MVVVSAYDENLHFRCGGGGKGGVKTFFYNGGLTDIKFILEPSRDA